jgi:hypothetical protein
VGEGEGFCGWGRGVGRMMEYTRKSRRIERDGKGMVQVRVGRKWVDKCAKCGKYHLGTCGRS